jgi:hypothetical protein
MKAPTSEQLAAALRAASDSLPAGPAILYLIVATAVGDTIEVSSAGNSGDTATVRHIIETELTRYMETN